MSKKFPVVYRIEGNKREGRNAVAFFPYSEATNGYLVCYAHIGQHSEGSLGYYMQTKAPRDPEAVAMVAALREEVAQIYESEPDAVTLVEKKRLPHDFRDRAWGGR